MGPLCSLSCSRCAEAAGLEHCEDATGGGFVSLSEDWGHSRFSQTLPDMPVETVP